MGRSMVGFIGTYNARKTALAAAQRQAVEAKMTKQAEHKTFLTRKAEIEELVATRFHED